jgi:4-hydroxy-tetrahydrodipicolinate synthase
MKKVIFTGSGTALITPFDSNGKVDYKVLDQLIEYQISNSTDAIITCGTTGESATLSYEEHLEVIKYTCDKVNKRIPVIAGTGSNDTAFSIKLSCEAEKYGVDGLLLVTPYYNKTSQKGLIESFNKVANSVSLPCVLYNVPSRTGMNILPETYYELAKNSNIVAAKEANGDIAALAKTISLCGDDLTIYSGEDSMTLPIIALGGKGVISVFSNALPKEMHEFCMYALENNMDKAREFSNRYIKLMNAFFMDVNPIPIKEAMNLMGYHVGKCRLPLTDMTIENKNRFEKILKEYNLI